MTYKDLVRTSKGTRFVPLERQLDIRCEGKYWSLGAFAKFRKGTNSFVVSVCPSALNNSAPT